MPRSKETRPSDKATLMVCLFKLCPVGMTIDVGVLADGQEGEPNGMCDSGGKVL